MRVTELLDEIYDDGVDRIEKNKPLRAGDVLDENDLHKRILRAVTEHLNSGIDAAVWIHNVVCEGNVDVYEDDNGDPVNVGGRPFRELKTEEWAVIFTEGERGEQ